MSNVGRCKSAKHDSLFMIYIVYHMRQAFILSRSCEIRGAKQGGGVWGSQPPIPPPPEFWIGGLNTCHPP